MEESERTEEQLSNENKEINDFSQDLINFPHIIKYINKIEERLRLQQDYISKLENKLTIFEEQFKAVKKISEDVQTQTDWSHLKTESKFQEWSINDKNESMSITDQVTEAATSAMSQTGFVYEETTGMYYHYDSGYYYNAELGLYYNGSTGTYYYYDKDSESYKFHSQVPRDLEEEVNSTSIIKETEKTDEMKNKDRIKKVKLMKEKETKTTTEGSRNENSDSENDENLNTEKDFLLPSNNENEKDEDVAKTYPPCMRIIVKETNLSNFKIGTLFIVTYIGGSIGREGDHCVIIPDINISKHHAKLQYNDTKKFYEIIDLGSRNGTILNGKRLSVAKQESEPTEVVHGSILQLNSTKLLCHIHNGYETCGHCEPGLLQSNSLNDESIIPVKHKYQTELKRLKCKFGIEQSNDAASRVAAGYQDRAQLRRECIGSSSEYDKTQQSSINESISKNNVGFKMLSKMGWTEGKCLGKGNDGVTEPVSLSQTINKSGFGKGDQDIYDVQIDPNTEKKQIIWKKAQRRFNEIID